MIAFYGAFHGRTMGALSLTGSKVTQRAGFAPLIPEVSHIEFPHCYRCKHQDGNCCLDCLDQLENNLFRHKVPPSEVAAIIVEPIQGEGGYIVPPPDFHRQLKAIAEKHGILYIADEVQTGMGRTGKLFAMEHWGVVPDITCLAKGIASGMPLGAIIAKEEIMNWPPGSHASTFGGNPVSCAAALETIALLEEELIENAAKQGKVLIDRLQELARQQPLIGEVRGLGLMIGVELVRDQASREPAITERDAVIQGCFKKGLLLLGCGSHAVRFCPPLMIDEQQAEKAVAIFAEALSGLA